MAAPQQPRNDRTNIRMAIIMMPIGNPVLTMFEISLTKGGIVSIATLHHNKGKDRILYLLKTLDGVTSETDDNRCQHL